MVEITCPYCEQTHERTDLVDLNEQPASIALDPEDLPPAQGSDTITPEKFECGAPIGDDGRSCTREVSSPNERCWQHPVDDEQ